jgi:hypothetical protein
MVTSRYDVTMVTSRYDDAYVKGPVFVLCTVLLSQQAWQHTTLCICTMEQLKSQLQYNSHVCHLKGFNCTTCVCVWPPTVNLKQQALSNSFISPTIMNNAHNTADSNMHLSHRLLAQFRPLRLRPLTWSRKGAITTVSRLRAGRLGVRIRKGTRCLLLQNVHTPILGPPTNLLTRPKNEVNHTDPYTAEMKNMWNWG